MTYEQFIASLRTAGVEVRPNECLEQEWVVGGETGNGCYSDDVGRPITPEPEPDFLELEQALAAVCPSITFLQYKSLLRGIERRDHSTRSDGYYGDFDDLIIKKILLKELYAWLQEHSLL